METREDDDLRRKKSKKRDSGSDTEPVAHQKDSDLDRAADVEFAHAGLECGAFDTENGRGTARAGDSPVRLL